MIDFLSVFCSSYCIFVFLSSRYQIFTSVFSYTLIWRRLWVGFFGSVYFDYLSFSKIMIYNQRSIKTILFDVFTEFNIWNLSWIFGIETDEFHSFLFIFHHDFFVIIGIILWFWLFLLFLNKGPFGILGFGVLLIWVIFLRGWLLIYWWLSLWFLYI